MKRSCFQAAVVSILLYGCTTWTLTKRLEKKLDGNYSRMLRAVLNKSLLYDICTKNMYNILSNHNKRLLNELTTRDRNPNVESCNCRNKEECPLGGRCTTRNVVYQACISPMEQQRDGDRVYIGISAGNRKQRWYSHRHSFSNPKLRYQTALSKYYWGLKDQGLLP